MSSGFFYETVAPLLCIGNTSFIAISTLTSEMNFYTKLISKIDLLTNKPVFKSIQISLACQQCIDAEKTHECLHMQHLIPRWQVCVLLSMVMYVLHQPLLSLVCSVWYLQGMRLSTCMCVAMILECANRMPINIDV